MNTGERQWDSEVSSVDTAILLCGVLTCRERFQNTEIRELAREIFNRVEWTWLSEDTPLLPHGWCLNWLPSLSLGLLQRNDDDVSAWTRIIHLPVTGRNVEGMETEYVRIR